MRPQRLACTAGPLLRRCYASKSESLRGAMQVTTPKERHKNEHVTDSAPVRAAQYQRQKEVKPVDDVTARILRQQQERRTRWQENPQLDSTYSLGVTSSFMDSKFQQMERDGEFKNLPGTGEPLPHRHNTHFGGEDAMDRMINRIMAENNVKPESVERRTEYLAKLKGFRARVEQSMEVQGPGATRKPLNRKACEAEISELQRLHKLFDSAAVKDSLTWNVPIARCPRVGDLEAEIAELRRSARAKPKAQAQARQAHRVEVEDERGS
jgi:hypothetical protein